MKIYSKYAYKTPWSPLSDFWIGNMVVTYVFVHFIIEDFLFCILFAHVVSSLISELWFLTLHEWFDICFFGIVYANRY